MKPHRFALLGVAALLWAGCSSSAPPAVVYEATNPAQVIEEDDGIQYVYLTEGPSYFAEDSVVVKEGTVVFHVTNEADRDVTFVLMPAGLRDESKALFKLNVPRNRTSSIKIRMEQGFYEYCCPINHTEWYPLEVVPRS